MSEPADRRTGAPARSAKMIQPVDTQIGWSVLLSAFAIWLALWGFWIIHSTHERLRGRTDLDMPDWFAINVELTFKVLPLIGLAGLLDLVAIGWFFSWAGQTGWTLRIGFVLQWAASVAIVSLLGWARLP